MARGLLTASAIIFCSSPLHAQPAPLSPAPVERPAEKLEPWRVGVSPENVAAANALLATATEQFVQRQYLEALETYRKALALWDHPALHFDVARCLVELDRPIEAAEHLERALAYGKNPLGDHLYADALEYQKLLAMQIGEVVVKCAVRGVEVAVDGRAVASCPAEQFIRLAPGEHFVVGTKQGYLTETKKVSVFGGKRAVVTIAPVPLDQAGEEVRRWPLIVPWTVVGGGVVLGGIGGLLRWQATNDMASYDTAIRQGCRGTGCSLAPALPACAALPGGCGVSSMSAVNESLRHRAIQENRFAIGVGAIGIAALITGGVLLYLDRAERIYPIVDSAPGGASIGMRGGF